MKTKQQIERKIKELERERGKVKKYNKGMPNTYAFLCGAVENLNWVLENEEGSM